MNKDSMTVTPFFSIIMPAYNAASFIETALRSIYRQDCTDYEIIVVNDGSTDSTADVLAHEKDDRLNVFLQKNSGAAAARNKGIREARGKYLAFLDADDVWLPNHLSVAKYFFENYPQYVWYSARCKRIDSDELLNLASYQSESIARSYSICNWFLEPDILECGSNFIIKREVVSQWTPFYPEGIVLCEDNVAWSRLAMLYPQMGVPDCCTVLYRMWSGSAVHKYGQCADILQTSLQEVFRIHQKLYHHPECSEAAQLFFKKFSCYNWYACLRLMGRMSWMPAIKERMSVTGMWISYGLICFSWLSHVFYCGAAKLMGIYIKMLDVKMERLAKIHRVEGLK